MVFTSFFVRVLFCGFIVGLVSGFLIQMSGMSIFVGVGVMLVLGIVMRSWKWLLVCGMVFFGCVRGQAVDHGFRAANVMTRSASVLSPWHWRGRLHDLIDRRVDTYYTSSDGALLKGILYGAADFSYADMALYRQAGLTHIVAVSGANLTMLAMSLAPMFSLFRFSLRLKSVLLSFVVIGFTFFTGGASPILRACVMALLAVGAPIVGRAYSSERALFVAAFCIMAVHPEALFFDKGFMLSFLAMFGLVYGTEIFMPWFERYGVRGEPATVGASSIAVLCSSMPYLLWSFGSTSWVGSVFTPIVSLYLPWLTLFGALSLFISMAAYPAAGLLFITRWVASLSLPCSVCVVSWKLSFGAMMACYVVMMWLVIHRRTSQHMKKIGGVGER